MTPFQLRRFCSEVDERLGSRDAPELLSVSQTRGVVPRSVLTDKEPRAEELSKYKVCEVGDLVLNRFNAYRGALGRVGLRGIVSPDYLVLRPTSLGDSRFLAYRLLATDFSHLMKASMGGLGAADPDSSGFSRIDARALLRSPTSGLSARQQLQIADYLDAQTAKIDALIGKQEQLIETLAERRQAVISHAVTKGLDPNAPMTDSGIQWIGSIPNAWSLKRISWLFRTVGSGTTPPSDNDLYYGEGTPWVTTGELREGTITQTTKSVTALALTNFSTLRVYSPGTLLIAMYGATIGRLALLGVPACTNQACCAMENPVGIETKFAFYALLAAKEHILVLAVGGGQPNINQDTLRSLRLPTPPMTEQHSIVQYLDTETSKIDALAAKAREMIDILKERRQALISAAVTGKIDVRGLA